MAEAGAPRPDDRRRAPARAGGPRARIRPDLRRGADRRAEATISAPFGEVIASLEAARDHAGLARAWRVQAMISSRAGRYDDVARAAERLSSTRSRAGELRLRRARCVGLRDAGRLELAARRRPDARIEQFLERVHGDRKAEANISLALAQLYAMQGDFDRGARALPTRPDAPPRPRAEHQRDRRRPSRRHGWSCWPATSRPPRLSSGAMTRTRPPRRALLPVIDRRRARPGPAARGQARRGGALRAARRGDRRARGHRSTGAVAVRPEPDPRGARRRPRPALALSEEAIELTEETEDVVLKADALVDHSAVLTTLGRAEAAESAVAAALALYEQKGDVVSAARIRRRCSRSRRPEIDDAPDVGARSLLLDWVSSDEAAALAVAVGDEHDRHRAGLRVASARGDGLPAVIDLRGAALVGLGEIDRRECAGRRRSCRRSGSRP